METPTCSKPSTSELSAVDDAIDCAQMHKLAFIDRSPAFTLLPENTIKQIYSHLQYKDVLRSHRICRRIRNVLQRNAHYLSRPKVSELSVKMGLVEKRNRPLGRLQIPVLGYDKIIQRRLNVMYIRKQKSSKSQEEFVEKENLSGDRYVLSQYFLERLTEHLKKIVVDGRISFTGIAFDTPLYERLTRKWVNLSEAHSLLFTLCRFRLDSNRFRNFLSKANCRKLNIELSHFDDQILNDYALEGMSECNEFSASGTYPRHFSGLTDQTLNRWAAQKRPPRRIFLHNVWSNFTLDGVLNMINSLDEKIPKCDKNSSCMQYQKSEWSFGRVNYFGESGRIVQMLSLPGRIVHTTNSDYLSDTVDVTVTPRWLFMDDVSNRCSHCSPTIQFQLVLNSVNTN